MKEGVILAGISLISFFSCSFVIVFPARRSRSLASKTMSDGDVLPNPFLLFLDFSLSNVEKVPLVMTNDSEEKAAPESTSPVMMSSPISGLSKSRKKSSRS